MNTKFFLTLIVFLLLGSLAWQAAADNPQLFGDPLPGLSAEQLAKFDAGKDEFSEEDSIEEGLGPVFNGQSCAECHSGPAVGGDSDLVETRFGTMTNGKFDPLTQFGGSLIQSKGLGEIPGAPCNISGETVPPEATIVAGRKTTPLFGLGLVDHVPDQFFLGLAQLQRRITPETAGRPNLVTDIATGRLVVG